MYVLLSGAKKNLGDALILERCRALLLQQRPDRELCEAPSWEPLPRSLRGTAKAFILPGGPGYRPTFHPRVYPLVSDLRQLEVPIFAIGLGWKGVPGDRLSLEGYRFTKPSRIALERLEEHAALGCRDYLTMEVLRRNGLTRTTMTGCPVWYHLASLGKPMLRPDSIRRLVFTPAQLPVFRDQSIEVARVLAMLFPEADKLCSFHRGIDQVGEWFDETERSNNRAIAKATNQLGFEVLDASRQLGQLEEYEGFDLHVGYRVHGHIHFLSTRRPSLLLHEDGRGIGASEALGLRGIDAFRRTLRGTMKGMLQRHGLGRALPLRRAARIIGRGYTASDDVAEAVRQQLLSDLDARFARYAGVAGRIDAQFQVMQRFLAALP